MSAMRRIAPSGVKLRPFFRTDVTKYDVLQKTFNQVVEDFGRIDGL